MITAAEGQDCHTVTGATGLLGSHVVAHLLSLNERVRVIHRPQSNLATLQKVLGYYLDNTEERFREIEFVQAELMDIDSLGGALEGCTYLYHCAAMVSFDPKDRERVLYDNPLMTENVVNAALAHPPRKIIYVSSVAALGRRKNQTHYDETSSWVESKHNSAYAQGKYKAELHMWRGMEEGLCAAIVNPTIILGAGTWQQGSAALFDTIAGGFPFYSTGTNGFVDARDVAAIMHQLMHSSISGERFVVVGENRSFKDTFFAIADALSVKRPFIAAQPWMTEIVWRLEKIKQLWGGKPAVTRETARAARETYFYQNDKIKAALGFEFRALDDSIRDFARLYQEDQQKIASE